MMQSVSVDKDRLLSTLRANREKHVSEYNEAVKIYREEACRALRRRANEIKAEETLSHRIDLVEPQTFAEDYDRAIAMAEWSVEETIDLDESEFRSYVLDEWAWRRAFAANTSSYIAGRSR